MTVTPAMASRIEMWPLDRLKPYQRNARTHSDAQVAQIAASIVEFGFTAPLLVSEDGGILAGHGRLAAARKLDLDAVPVVVLDHLTPTQRRAYILADNQLALQAGWDQELLAIELADLSAAGFDLALTGFSDEELADLLGDIEEAVRADEDLPIGEPVDEDIPEAPVTPVSQPGDIWQLGAHRLICGDSTDPAVVAALMAGEIAEEARFFSFGTNDLTQTTLGVSRDDAARFLTPYVEQGIYPRDPFVSLDVEGVGQLVELAAERGRNTRADLKLGICGEHGGDPASIAFCEAVGLDYVSASPYRVPIARLAAAQAALNAASR